MTLTVLRWASTLRMRLTRSAMTRDDGFTTAEYAVGTVAVAGFAGILIKILTSDLVRELIWSIIRRAFEFFLPF